MPPLAAVPNVLRADFPFTYGEDVHALNRVFISYTGTAPTDATCTTLAGDLGVDWATEFAPYSTDQVTYEGCTLTDLSSSTAGQGTYANAVDGSLAVEPLGASTAFLGSMKIARRYRGGKPRTYLPIGGAGKLQDAQTWTSAFVADIQAALNQIIADIAVTSSGGCALGNLVNVSYYEGFVSSQNPITLRWRTIPKQRTAGPLVDPVTSWVAETRIGSQRRRNLRGS